jgi:hypothetical protein
LQQMRLLREAGSTAKRFRGDRGRPPYVSTRQVHRLPKFREYDPVFRAIVARVAQPPLGESRVTGLCRSGFSAKGRTSLSRFAVGGKTRTPRALRRHAPRTFAPSHGPRSPGSRKKLRSTRVETFHIRDRKRGDFVPLTGLRVVKVARECRSVELRCGSVMTAMADGKELALDWPYPDVTQSGHQPNKRQTCP